MNRTDPVTRDAVQDVRTRLAALPVPVPPAELRARWLAALDGTADPTPPAPDRPAVPATSGRRVATVTALAAAALVVLAVVAATLLGLAPGEPFLPAQLTGERNAVVEPSEGLRPARTTDNTGITFAR